ncbi:transmembrane protein, putative (macronuclear) [Tetrahymena thermophila SB210]|uniref:Transmembrane protein, putative n=1 Tax=Tetrahymena thermophila (strain SB210) TaxID=312017 RepID=Q23HC2_TETTS|nr:transmembrane protein, putative [Tetrahymena thermophila SB210]EAR95886.2 transmembrane protein, putative [Tetrahymena thermophila SB210]|eukprot:XP_001016131.2 transmembrane protein, putative [Tetrahymena thermophila SB210]
MDKENIDFSDVEKFLLTHYIKCPTHKRSVIYLRLDDEEDPQVIKCQKCLDEKKYKCFIDIIELLQSDNHFIFQKWPIHDDDSIYEKLEQIRQWPFAKYCQEINLLFDEIIEAIQSKRKSILKNLGLIEEITQKPLNFFKEICQKEKLIDIIKTQFGDQKKQNEMILNIIKQNQENYEKNKNLLIELINQANKNLFGLDKIQNIKEEVLSSIQKVNNFDDLQVIVDQSNNITIENYDQCFKKIKITKIEELNKYYDYQKIKIDFREQYLSFIDIYIISQSLNKFKKINEFSLRISGNTIYNENVCQIIKGLFKYQTLTKLKLKFGDTFNYIGSEGAKCIAQFIKQNNNLVKLHLNTKLKDIDQEGASSIADAIEACQNLNNLTLYFRINFNSAERFKKITRAIEKLQKLEILKLDCSSNYIGNEIAKVISNSLEKNINLKELDLNLDYSKIEDEGAFYIGDALTKLQNIQILKLSLSCNQIGVKGAQKIIKDLENNKKIQDLHINLSNSNEICKSVIVASLKQTYESFSQIKNLNIKCNQKKTCVVQNRIYLNKQLIKQINIFVFLITLNLLKIKEVLNIVIICILIYIIYISVCLICIKIYLSIQNSKHNNQFNDWRIYLQFEVSIYQSINCYLFISFYLFLQFYLPSNQYIYLTFYFYNFLIQK